MENTISENESPPNDRTNTLERISQSRWQITCFYILFINPLRRLFFLGKMSSTERKHVIWIWIILLSLFGGLYLRCHVFQKRSIILSPSDMAIVDPIVPFFCASISICYNGNKIKAYVSTKKPKLNKTKVEYNFTSSFNLTKDHEKIWPIHLLPNSSLSMRLCSKGPSQLGIITSKENFEKWKSDKRCTHCIKQFLISSTCIKINSSEPHAYTYYIVFRNEINTSFITANISLKRTSYKISGRNVLVKKPNGCSQIPVAMRSTEYILLQYLSKQWNFVKLKITYNSRNYMFVIFFLILPFSLGMLFSLIVEKMVNSDFNEELEESEESTSTLSVIEYMNSTRPPSYDSLFPESDPNTLPPYQKCTEIGVQKSV